MLKQTILATATAGFIAAGGLATSTAANADSVQFGGPNWSVQIGNPGYGYGQFRDFHPKKKCEPIVRKVKWWDRFGYPHWSEVVVGQKCFPVKFPHHNGPFPPNGNPGPIPPHIPHDGPYGGPYGGWDNGGNWNNHGGW